MITITRACEIALDYAKREFEKIRAIEMVILDEYTIEKPRGWAFSSQNRHYVETRKIKFAIIGFGAIFVDKETCKIVQFGSGGTVEYWYNLYIAGKTREDADGIIHLVYR